VLKGTDWWPDRKAWDGAVFYFETSPLAPDLWLIEQWLRNYATQGILETFAAILIGRPSSYSLEKKFQLFAVVKKLLSEVGRTDMPVVADLDFGHTSPSCVLPTACQACVTPSERRLELVEAAVSCALRASEDHVPSSRERVVKSTP